MFLLLSAATMDNLENLRYIQNILQEASKFLCSHLSPQPMLRNLKARGAITVADLQNIKSQESSDDSIDCLLDTLQCKPESAYIAFVEELKGQRRDLYDKVKKLEAKNHYIPSKNYHSPFVIIIIKKVTRVLLFCHLFNFP